MAKSSLAALAILKVNWETQGADYLDNFMPMVVACLAQSPDDIISLPKLKTIFAERFGIDIPLNPLQSILQRAARAGYIRRDHGVFYKTRMIGDFNFDEEGVPINDMLDEVVSEIQGYARHRFTRNLLPEQVEDALLSFLSAQDATLLFASFEGTPLRRPPENASLRYIVASFVYDIWSQGSDVFSQIETLAKGNILATALFLPDLGQVARRFRDTKVFFDTSFLMFAAGYAGEDRERPRGELLRILKDHGAELRVFPETIDEIRGILCACAAIFRKNQFRDAYGPSIEYFIRNNMSSSDIDLLEARVPERLQFLGVDVQDRPSFDDHSHIIDEVAFETYLDKKISYRNPDARRHDVDCISAVARLRRGRVFSIEQCRALFVTTNVVLARATHTFFRDNLPVESVPLALTSDSLGTLLWLKNPAKASELPKRMLIANAYAALQPSDELWKKYLTEIARLEEREDISKDDYHLLRFTLGAKRAFMDITKGDEETFTEGTIKEVLTIAIENTRADLESKLRQEKDKRIEGEAIRDKMQQRIQETEEALNIRNATAEQRSDQRRFRRNHVALVAAKIITLIPRITLYSVTLIAAIYVFYRGIPNAGSEWFGYLLAVAFCFLLGLEISGLVWGHTLKSLIDRLEISIAKWIGQKLLWLEGDDDIDVDRD